MGYSVVVNGVTIRTDSPHEAIELARVAYPGTVAAAFLGSSPALANRHISPSAPPENTKASIKTLKPRPVAVQKAVSMLQKILSHEGTSSVALVELVGASGPQGLGPYTRLIKKLAREHGVQDPDNLLRTSKGQNGETLWFANAAEIKKTNLEEWGR